MSRGFFGQLLLIAALAGLLRVELYARVVRLGSPDMCASVERR